ncbi:MAG TPA: alkaline phosphatase family protein [Acidobacteriaceae bacterium]|nr:alkaline phosphatase family protein [Acidobacteriaceae bacterium]
MSHFRYLRTLGSIALASAFCNFGANAQEIKKVFVIAMENHNWTQPANQFTGPIQQIFQNPNAPFINSLVNGTALAVINDSTVNISQQVAYATAYHNVLATSGGNNPHIHPSEPNYLWADAGTNFGVANDNDPFGANGTNQNTPLHLTNFLTRAGKTWKSYQEDIDLARNDAGQLINVPLPQDQWTVPLTSFSGVFGNNTFNSFNGANQFNYAAKHNPMVFFSDTNGGNNATPTNPLSQQYAPLQQLMTDLANNTVADYTWITPNQYNDMHTTLAAGYKGLTGDSAKILQGDDFLKQIVPAIMASDAYKNHGAIILWWDESETDGVAGDNPDDLNHTVGEIVISSRAHKNVNGLPYASPVNFTHSSDLRTMQEIFDAGPFLGDAVNANDLSDLFDAGAIPKKP